jgi:hypothetical protein
MEGFGRGASEVNPYKGISKSFILSTDNGDILEELNDSETDEEKI